LNVLDVRQIDVYRGKAHVVQQVSFGLDEREIVAIVGSNGAGKTTLLKSISGVLRISRGSITILGKRVDSLPSHRIVTLGVVHVPEGRKLFKPMTVLENLEMGSYLIQKPQGQQTFGKVFELFPILEQRKNQMAGSLSGGEQQMLAIARGLMSNPKLFMLDEPSLGLAPIMVKEVFRIVKWINEAGISVLLVEQNVRQSLSIAKRGYVLENGRIVLTGKGEDLLKNESVKETYLGM
jgi:branched-chain amino acid transport system ATP-binding protein